MFGSLHDHGVGKGVIESVFDSVIEVFLSRVVPCLKSACQPLDLGFDPIIDLPSLDKGEHHEGACVGD